MKEKHIIAHMEAAHVYAKLSSCTRLKVGCLIIKNDTPIGLGYNGTPEGWDNCCEGPTGLTLPEVSHAEENAFSKVTRSHESSEGASLFVTIAPCLPCATDIVRNKIKEVFYGELYRNDDGLKYLEKAGIPTRQIKV